MTERPPCIATDGEHCQSGPDDSWHLDWVSESGYPDRMWCALYDCELRPFAKPRRCGKCKRTWKKEEP